MPLSRRQLDEYLRAAAAEQRAAVEWAARAEAAAAGVGAPGAIVRRKHGGPLMTVERSEAGQLWCVWFEGALSRRDVIDAAQVELVTPAPPSLPPTPPPVAEA
jgi:uncharacterized protein YodC (DUF2158 family)